jgi:hypothetical protein
VSAGESLVKLKGLGERKYLIAKLGKFKMYPRKKSFKFFLTEKQRAINKLSFRNITTVEESFQEITRKEQKITILTLLPKSFNIRKVQ